MGFRSPTQHGIVSVSPINIPPSLPLVHNISTFGMVGLPLLLYILTWLATTAFLGPVVGDERSAVGDPGMRRDGLRVAFEAWNFCNEVGEEAPHMGSQIGRAHV